MKERKAYAYLRIGSTQAHRARTRALLSHRHLQNWEKSIAWARRHSHRWRGVVPERSWGALGSAVAEESWRRSKASLVGQ